MSEPEDRMDPRLENAFKHLKAVPPRSASAAARGRAEFLAQAKAAPPRRGWYALFSRKTSFAIAAAIMLFLVLVVGGTGATAYAAEDSLPDSPLYPVKLLTENTRLALAFQPETKLDLILSFADRRMNEIAAMDKGQAAPPEAVANHLEEELDQALEIAIALPDAQRDKALAKMQTRIQRQTQKASELPVQSADRGQGVVLRVKKALQDRLELVEMGKADPPGLKKKMQEPKKEIAPTATPEKGQRPAVAPGQERKPSPGPKDTPQNKGNDKGNGNGNGKR